MTLPRAGTHARSARRPVPALLALSLVAMLALAPSMPGRLGLTDAAWVDREYVRSQVAAAASWCQQGLYRTEGRGQLVAGRLAGRDLAAIAEVAPLRVRHAGSQTTVTPTGAVALGADAYTNPLTVAALQALSIDLGQGLLSFPLSTGEGAGVLNQYARATTAALSAGASGAVSSSGAVDARTQQPGSGLPDVASVNLRALTGNLLDPAISTAVADDVTDLTVRVGAVAASSTLDACIARTPAVSTRSYGVANLRLDATSRAVGALAGTASTAVGVVQAGIGPTGSLASTLGTAVTGALNGVGALTAAVGLGAPRATLTVNANLPAAVAPLLTQTLGADSAVQVELATGAVHVDLARLTNGTNGVNNLDPNSEILSPAVLDAATAQVAALLSTWASQVSTTVTGALDAASTTLVVDIPLSATVLGATTTITTLRVTVAGSYATLAAGSGAVTFQLVGGCTVTVTCAAVTAALQLAGTPVLVASAVGTTLRAVAQPGGLIGVLGSTLTTAVAGVTGSGGVLRALFAGLPSVVSVQVNARPDVAQGLRPGLTVQPGEYAVSALRVGLVDPARGAWIAFGSATAGPNLYTPPA
ncbi:MAG TPA: choice-of-anchor G family protein [Cellulomonas sp.]